MMRKFNLGPVLGVLPLFIFFSLAACQSESQSQSKVAQSAQHQTGRQEALGKGKDAASPSKDDGINSVQHGKGKTDSPEKNTHKNDDESMSDWLAGKGPHQSPGQSPGQHPGQSPLIPKTYSSITGDNNNLQNPSWGAADTVFRREIAPQYSDGSESPAGSTRPSARAISNAVVAQSGSILNDRLTSDYIWQWGQFLDHDLDLAEEAAEDEKEAFNILVPTGDIFFDPTSAGDKVIALTRSKARYVAGVRRQINGITSFIDASQVYGSSEDRAQALRTNDGTGKLKVSEGDLLPFNDDGLPNAPSSAAGFFLAGDVRANEQAGLTAMHTLFVREHNTLCEKIAKIHPYLSGEKIYQLARSIVAAEMQIITYNEFLPLLLGSLNLAPYNGYDPSVNPAISNLFATAAYRFGHSSISPEIKRLDKNLATIAEGNLALKDAFFNPELMKQTGGIDPVLRGLAKQVHQNVDTKVIDGLRNFLFGPPGAGGFDLAALNIQRGRDHGLPSYNQTRIHFGLAPAADFSDITSDPETAANLAAVYNSVDDIDLWVGGLAEDHVSGGLIGELFATIIADQFDRLRRGDRFYYQRHLKGYWRRYAEEQTLAKIIRRNTGIGSELQDNVFVVGGE